MYYFDILHFCELNIFTIVSAEPKSKHNYFVLNHEVQELVIGLLVYLCSVYLNLWFVFNLILFKLNNLFRLQFLFMEVCTTGFVNIFFLSMAR